MKVERGVCFALAAALAVNASADVAEEVRAARAEIESNSVDRTVSSRYYRSWYIDQCTKEEHDGILARNIAAHRRLIALEPDNPAHHASLGKVLAAVDRWDEAKKELAVALEGAKKLGPYWSAFPKWEMANCLWKEGDKEDVKKIVDELASQKWSGNVPGVCNNARYMSLMMSGPDADLDHFSLPHNTDGKPFPTPQEAEYGDGRVSLAKVEIRVLTGGTSGTGATGASGLASPAGLSGPDDPIVRLLTRKLQRFGSKFEKGGTPVTIEISPDAPVDRPQGYSLDVAPGSVRVRARSRLGATWGVVSLLQCIDRERLAVAECSIRDWPVCERRGVILYWQPDFLEYALFNKMTTLTVRMDGIRTQRYTLPPLEREQYRLYLSRFREYGFETYVAANGLTGLPTIPLSSPRTFKLHLAWSRLYASLGAGNSFMFDDFRFPVPQMDLDAAGTAANLDADYLTRLYRAVKKDYPDFRMQFCPPFYFGPDGPARYPEPREPYLKSLGEKLDPEIDVYWTGPRVKSGGMSDERTDWFANLIGRKPAIFHNGDCRGRHTYIQYGADVSGFKTSHSTNLFDHIAVFQENTSRYQSATTVGSAMDWCWNPVAHDPETAARRTVEMLEGPGVFELIKAGTPALAHFDGYVYGQPRSELFGEDPDELDRLVADAESTWAKVSALAKNGGLFVGDFNRCGLKWAKQLARYRRNPPAWLLEQYKAEMANASFAKNEAGYDEAAGDAFFPAEMLVGGLYVKNIGDRTNRGRRNVKYVGVGQEVSGRFSLEPFPPERPPRLIAMGCPWNNHPAPLEVEVNGRVIWRGEPFSTPKIFTKFEIEIPVEALERNSRFVIRNTAPEEENFRKPEIHYVVIKK